MSLPLPEFKPEVIEKLVRMGPAPKIFDDAFTARVLKQLTEKGLLPRKRSRLSKASLTGIKYSYLVRIIKKQSPETKLPAPKKGDMLTNEQIESMLIEDKLLTSSKKPTPFGLRWVAKIERAQKMEK